MLNRSLMMSMTRRLPVPELFLCPSKVARKPDQKDEHATLLLSEDLLIEILYRISIKHANQCKAVCKRWNYIISNPYFAKRIISQQLQIGPQPSCHKENLEFHHYNKQAVFTRQQELDRQFSLSFLPCYQSDEPIVASCHDLLLCSLRGSGETMFYVCNPVTRQWTEIPPVPDTDYNQGYTPTGFICDPYYHTDDQGCVTVNPHRRFKILRAYINSTYEDVQFDVDIFSSETGKWSNIKLTLLRNYKPGPRFYSKRGVNYRGKMYFQRGTKIVAFDPSSNRLCGDIDLPEDYELNEKFKFNPYAGFGCSRDSLWICWFYYRILHIWRLKDDEVSPTVTNNLNLSWSLEREVALPGSAFLGRHFPRTSSNVLLIHPDNPNIILLGDFFGAMIVYWDLTRGTLKVESLHKRSSYYRSNIFSLEVPIWPTPIPTVRN